MIMRHKNDRRRGAVYLLALTTMLVGMILALAMLRASSGYYLAENSRKSKQAAMNLAEAGIDYAYWQIHYCGKKLPYSADVTLNTGSVHVDATDDGSRDGSTMLVTATGTVGKHSGTVKRVMLGLLPYDYGLCAYRAFDTSNTITSTDSIGGIRSNSSVRIYNASANVTNGIWAGTTITTTGTATPQYTNSPPMRFPDIDLDYYYSNSSEHYAWGQTFLSVLYPCGGIIFVNGSIAISGYYSGCVTIVANGDINIKGPILRATSDSCLALITRYNINTDGGAFTIQALLYCHNSSNTSQIALNGAKTIVGSASGDYVYANGATVLKKDTVMDFTQMRQMNLPGL